MSDVELYNTATNAYDELQNSRPDYHTAIETAISLGIKNLSRQKDITVSDFCCGTGQHTNLLAKRLGKIEKAILVDINEEFLNTAKNLGIPTTRLEIQHSDILKANFKPESDVVLALFAYHHVTDNSKTKFIEQARAALKPQGIVVLGEIYLPDQATTIAYYESLYASISEELQNEKLKEFLLQTAKSSEFEFKVTQSFAHKQFIEKGFYLAASKKSGLPMIDSAKTSEHSSRFGKPNRNYNR